MSVKNEVRHQLKRRDLIDVDAILILSEGFSSSHDSTRHFRVEKTRLTVTCLGKWRLGTSTTR